MNDKIGLIHTYRLSKGAQASRYDFHRKFDNLMAEKSSFHQ